MGRWEGGGGHGEGERGGAEANLSIRGSSAFTHKKLVSERNIRNLVNLNVYIKKELL